MTFLRTPPARRIQKNRTPPPKSERRKIHRRGEMTPNRKDFLNLPIFCKKAAGLFLYIGHVGFSVRELCDLTDATSTSDFVVRLIRRGSKKAPLTLKSSGREYKKRRRERATLTCATGAVDGSFHGVPLGRTHVRRHAECTRSSRGMQRHVRGGARSLIEVRITQPGRQLSHSDSINIPVHNY